MVNQIINVDQSFDGVIPKVNWWNSNWFLKTNAVLEEQVSIYVRQLAGQGDEWRKSVGVADFLGRQFRRPSQLSLVSTKSLRLIELVMVGLAVDLPSACLWEVKRRFLPLINE